MTKKSIPATEYLHKILRYDPHTGGLYWRERTPDMFTDTGHSAERKCTTWNSRFAGKRAGNVADDGYASISVNYTILLAHRVIWKMHNGTDPSDQIDHIDGNRSNNRIENLRDVSRSDNQRNQAIMKNNTSGHHGVHYSKTEGMWRAAINTNGKKKTLGRYRCITAAIIARKIAEETYGYHKGHGKTL